MKKLVKKTLLVILFLMITLCGMHNIVIADSGWDSSYDSGNSGGSSSSGGGSFGGSSGSSNSEYWENSNISPGEAALVYLVVFIIAVTVITIALAKAEKKKQLNSSIINSDFDESDFVDVSHDKINKYDSKTSLDELKKIAFDVYKNIQEAWMNFDTDTIRNLTTDEMFNMYSSQLETLKIKGQKNIMKDIILNQVKVIDIKEENGVINVNVYLNVDCYDYVINEKTNKVLRGNNKNKLEIAYIITYVKSSTKTDGNIHCPNCEAVVEMNSSAECPYCGSTLVTRSSKYVMSKKTCIGQKMKRGV